MADRRLQGKIALITGGTSGIGTGTVRYFRREGAEVVFTGSNAEAAAQICDETGAHFVPQRVEDPSDWPTVMDAVQSRFGRLDIAFANAGTEKGDSDIENVSFEGWQSIIGINLTGVMLTVQNAVRMMRANPDGPKGSIILNSSMNAQRPLGNYVTYSTTKGALIALAKSTAVHCAQSKTAIRCNSIHPGVVETEMIRAIIDGAPEPAAVRAQFEAMAPMGRMAQVEEIAALVAFLGSDEAAFISGSEYGIDGATNAGMMGV
jgi:3(or 17)beta-hydroxysteroid dehydrogenase